MIDDSIFREQNVLKAPENGEEKQNEFLNSFHNHYTFYLHLER